MIPIREIAGFLHPAKTPARRHYLIFGFYCDESYDSQSKDPKTYNVAGFFGNQATWERLERRWDNKNKRVNVPRFHASHLNAGTYEFDGWLPPRRRRYSKDMLQVIKDQKGRLHGCSCGLYVDDYRKIISAEGQRKMGHPYLVCFKSLVAMVAEQMDYGKFPLEDKFAVILDQNKMQVDNIQLDSEAVRLFYSMKDNPSFAHRHRLATCTPGSWEDFTALQPADYIAYETYRLMNDQRRGIETMRKALNTMIGTTSFLCEMFTDTTLERIKDEVDAAKCADNSLVVIPKQNFAKAKKAGEQ
jgi:hypothetical protein